MRFATEKRNVHDDGNERPGASEIGHLRLGVFGFGMSVWYYNVGFEGIVCFGFDMWRTWCWWLEWSRINCCVKFDSRMKKVNRIIRFVYIFNFGMSILLYEKIVFIKVSYVLGINLHIVIFFKWKLQMIYERYGVWWSILVWRLDWCVKFDSWMKRVI